MSDPMKAVEQFHPGINDPVKHIPPLRLGTVRDVANDAVLEIQNQDRLARAGKFGGTHILPGGPNDARLRVLVEEVGEVAEELNEMSMGNETGGALYSELVQVAACALAWATALIEEQEGTREAAG